MTHLVDKPYRAGGRSSKYRPLGLFAFLVLQGFVSSTA